MKLLNTHFVGCDVDDNYVPSIEGSHILRLDFKSCYAYANILNELASACHLAHSIRNETDKPFEVSILIPQVRKKKPENYETNLDTINFFITKLKPPGKGIIFTVFEVKMDNIITPFHLANIWPFVDKWSPKDYISVQRPEPRLHVEKLIPVEQEYKKLVDILKMSKYNVKYVDYTMPTSHVYDVVLGSRLHISYTGASYWIAGAAKVPMIAFGPMARDKRVKEWGPAGDLISLSTTNYGVTSQRHWMRSYDEDENPVSEYNHFIHNIEKITYPSTRDIIDALANLKSSDRDMWFL